MAGLVDAVREHPVFGYLLGNLVDLAAGTDLTIDWAGVAAATDVAVDTCVLSVTPIPGADRSLGRDLVVTAPDGSRPWALPGPVPPAPPPPAPPVVATYRADLALPLRKALLDALKAGGPLRVAFHLAGGAGSFARVDFAGARGALLHAFPGRHSATLAGEAVVPDGFAGLAAEAPSAVTGDLAVTYLGLRVLTGLSDPLPAPGAVVAGRVLTPGGEPALRAFPPAGWGGLRLAKVALIGRAAEDCELSVALVRVPEEQVGTATSAGVAAASRIGAVWVDVPADAGAPVTGPAALRVTATSGRFLWAGCGAVLVVADPDPPPQPLTWGGITLLRAGAAPVSLPATVLPPTALTGAAAPLASALFCRVDLGDVTLQYARGTA